MPEWPKQWSLLSKRNTAMLYSLEERRWKTKQNSRVAILHRITVIIVTICCVLQGTLLVTHLILQKAVEVGNTLNPFYWWWSCGLEGREMMFGGRSGRVTAQRLVGLHWQDAWLRPRAWWLSALVTTVFKSSTENDLMDIIQNASRTGIWVTLFSFSVFWFSF